MFLEASDKIAHILIPALQRYLRYRNVSVLQQLLCVLQS